MPNFGAPRGWLGCTAAVAPPAAAGISRVVTGRVTAGWREATAFGLVIAVMTAGSWGVLQLPRASGYFVFVYPPALLAFLFGAANYSVVAASRTIRAWKGQLLDYPWIPEHLAAVLGVEDERNHRGNR